MTGLKHYLGPFEAYGQGDMPDTPFHEDEERLPYPNFYYAQEDELFAAAERDGFTWSVHRSHTVFGYATGNAMNMVATLCAYASLCRDRGLPFVFPGSETQWNALTDVTDADLLAEQMLWAASNPDGQDQAFNTANGDVFRWRWLWPQVAAWFGLEWEGFADRPRTLEASMADMAEVWRDLASREDLVEPDLARVASWWHSDADLGRDMEVVTDMNKSRTAGLLGHARHPRHVLRLRPAVPQLPRHPLTAVRHGSGWRADESRGPGRVSCRRRRSRLGRGPSRRCSGPTREPARPRPPRPVPSPLGRRSWCAVRR